MSQHWYYMKIYAVILLHHEWFKMYKCVCGSGLLFGPQPTMMDGWTEGETDGGRHDDNTLLAKCG